MAHKICFFDLLPVELLHHLFTYFLAHDILYSFTNISNHVDAVLLAYSSYRLNFKSIDKVHFDLVCSRIKPDQVISLTLSDDDDTPGQSELFLFHFRIDQFVHLQSLTLFKIEIDALKSIFFDLCKLNQLRSFSFQENSVQLKYSDWVYYDKNKITQLNQTIADVYIQVIPQLNRLSLSNGSILRSMSLPLLHSLILEETTVNELQIIMTQASELKSLNVCLTGDISNIECLHSLSQLNRLALKINDSPISMDRMEAFLLNLSFLTHLTLQITGSIDLADGHRWERLTTGYMVFNFKFKITGTNIEQILDTFRTPFWLQEKCWYVAYNDKFLFSIPKFAPTCVFNTYDPQYFTAPDQSFLYKNITKLIISRSKELDIQNFQHVEMLEFEYGYSWRDLVLMSRHTGSQQYTALSPSDIVQFLVSYLHSLPRCQKLSLVIDLTLEFIDKLSGKRFEHIRTLEIRSTNPVTRFVIEEMLRIFPRVECLYISSITSQNDMIRLIDGFKYLSKATVIIRSKNIKIKQNWLTNPRLALDGVRRLEKNTFTCRFNHSSETISYYFNVWINGQIRKPYWMIDWPPRCGYLYYRLKRMVTPHPDVSFVAGTFPTFLLQYAVTYCLVSIIVTSLSSFIVWSIAVLMYIILYIIGIIILSRCHFLREHKGLLGVLLLVNGISAIYFKFDLGSIIIYLFEMCKRLLLNS